MTDYTILDDIESMCDVVRVKNITIDFIKQYIINTEKCETLCTFLRNHHDNLDVKYKMHGLNETYNQIGHLGVLQMLLSDALGHVNIKDYCNNYGKFTRDNIINYIYGIEDNDVRIMINIFGSLNKLPPTHDVYQLSKNSLLTQLKFVVLPSVSRGKL